LIDQKNRDFLTSYDFKIFGKSWTNPQEVEMPLKSASFYGDSQINTFLGSSFSNTFENDNLVKKIKHTVFSQVLRYLKSFLITFQ
jgi:hypothetical protein